MNWIFVGTLLGSLVTSTHDNREACEGRAVILKEKGVTGKCDVSPATLSLTSSGWTIAPGTSSGWTIAPGNGIR